MMKCPFCQFENEDGALFCEQCKSDLTISESAAVAVPLAAPEFGSPTPVAEVAGPAGSAVVAEAALAEAVPVAQVQVEGGSATASAAGNVVSMPASGETIHGLTAPTVDPQAPGTSPAPPGVLPPGTQPKLVVLRGLRANVEYPIYPGPNYLGRAEDKPVDIDLEDQESPDRVYCSRQHAVLCFEDGMLTIEDLNSSNGTFVNRTRVYPGQKRPLHEHDLIQVGTIWLKVKT